MRLALVNPGCNFGDVIYSAESQYALQLWLAFEKLRALDRAPLLTFKEHGSSGIQAQTPAFIEDLECTF